MGFSLRSMFFFACLLGPLTCTSLFTFSYLLYMHPFHVVFPFDNSQIPDKVLERRPRDTVLRDDESSSSASHSQPSDVESEHYVIHDDTHNGKPKPRQRGNDGDAVMDPEHGETRSTPRRNC
jgi:hypothetical protein